MKTHLIVSLVVVCALLSVAASAQIPGITANLDEFGVGEIWYLGQFVMPIPSGIGPDIGPGGFPNALFYAAPPPYIVPFIEGDVLIFEPTGGLSDILRFNPDGRLVVYSDNSDGADSPADLGFPPVLWGNQVARMELGVEGNSWVDYTPLPGMPGFVIHAPVPVTYHFVSDKETPPVPEFPAPLLAAIGGIGGLVWRRRK